MSIKNHFIIYHIISFELIFSFLEMDDGKPHFKIFIAELKVLSQPIMAIT